MKKIQIFLLACLLVVATTTVACAWECGASSNYGFGIGHSSNKSMARKIAIHQCRMNTPRGDKCYIDYCVR